MRHTFLMIILLVICSIGDAQNTGEQKAIEAQIDAFLTSWNKHDFSDMKNYIAEDCDFVNIVGMHWKGREEVQYAHQAFHEQVLKNTLLEKAISNNSVFKSRCSNCPYNLAYRCF